MPTNTTPIAIAASEPTIVQARIIISIIRITWKQPIWVTYVRVPLPHTVAVILNVVAGRGE